MLFTVPRGLKEVNLHKGILSLTLRDDLNWNLVDNWFFSRVSSSPAWWWKRNIDSCVCVSLNSILDNFNSIVMQMDELLELGFKIAKMVETKIGCNFFDFFNHPPQLLVFLFCPPVHFCYFIQPFENVNILFRESKFFSK